MSSAANPSPITNSVIDANSTGHARAVFEFLAGEAVAMAKANLSSREGREAAAAIQSAKLAFDRVLWRLEDEGPIGIEAKPELASELLNVLLHVSRVVNRLLACSDKAKTAPANEATRALRPPGLDAKILELAIGEERRLEKDRPFRIVTWDDITFGIKDRLAEWLEANNPSPDRPVRPINEVGIKKRLAAMEWKPRAHLSKKRNRVIIRS